MAAIWMCARSTLRRRFGSTIVVALLIALAGAAVLTALAGARRTSSSFDRFREESRAGHLVATMPTLNPELANEIAQLPGVTSVGRIYNLAAFDPDVPDEFVLFANIDGHVGTVLDRSRLIAGRYADPERPHEVTFSESAALNTGVDVGDTLHIRTFTQRQVDLYIAGTFDQLDGGPAAGPRMQLEVVGIERRPFDLTSEGEDSGVTFLTPAFFDTYGESIGSFLGEYLRVRLDDGPAGISAFTRAVKRVAGDVDVGFRNESFDTGGIGGSIDVMVAALLLFAAIASVAGAVALGQAAARQSANEMPSHGPLRALGMTNGEHALALTLAGLPAVLLGTLTAIGGAFAMSSIMPFGIAARAEPDPGVSFDVLVLLLGGLGIAALSLALFLVTAWRLVRAAAVDERSTPRVSRLTDAVGRSHLGPTVTAGVQLALHAGRGTESVPTRPASVGVAFAVAAVLAVGSFQASLDRLTDTPARFGWNWDTATIPNSEEIPGPPCQQQLPEGAAHRDIEGLANMCFLRVVIDDRPVQAYGIESLVGSVEPTIVGGRAPRTTGEVALGAKTLKTTGREIGDVVTSRGPEGEYRYRIVGQAVIPTIGEVVAINEGAIFTTRGLDRLDFGESDVGQFFLVSVRAGAGRRAAIERFDRAVEQRDSGLDPPVPDDIDRLHQVDVLPPVLGGLLVLLALLAVGHALVTGVRRRRRHFAVLKTVGFTRRQVMAAVSWQASTIVAIGIVIGVPLGVLLGQIAWGLVAGNLGVASDTVLQPAAILVVVPAALVIAIALAALPARAAARTQPAIALRAE